MSNNDEKDTMTILISAIQTLVDEVRSMNNTGFPETPGTIMGEAMLQALREQREAWKKSQSGWRQS